MSAADRMKAMRARKATSGVITVRVDAYSEEHAAMIRDYARALRAAYADDFARHDATMNDGSSTAAART